MDIYHSSKLVAISIQMMAIKIYVLCYFQELDCYHDLKLVAIASVCMLFADYYQFLKPSF